MDQSEDSRPKVVLPAPGFDQLGEVEVDGVKLRGTFHDVQVSGSVAKRRFLSELFMKICYVETFLAIKFITTSQSPLLTIRSLNDVRQVGLPGRLRLREASSSESLTSADSEVWTRAQLACPLHRLLSITPIYHLLFLIHVDLLWRELQTLENSLVLGFL